VTSKYERLTNHLQDISGDSLEVTLTFKKLESILGFTLPISATDYRQWWGNTSDSKGRSQAQSWKEAGFKVDSVQLKKPGGWVRFKRI